MNEVHAKAVGLLKTGEKPKDVAEECGLTYHKVLGIKKKMEWS
jgi:hypothetical protein